MAVPVVVVLYGLSFCRRTDWVTGFTATTIGLSPQSVSSFSLTRRQRRSDWVRYMAAELDSAAPLQKQEKQSPLTFTANILDVSEPIGNDSNESNKAEEEEVIRFFKSPLFLKSFLCDSKSGGSELVQILPVSTEYRQLWTDVCGNEAYRYGTELELPPLLKGEEVPNASQCAIVLAPTSIKFPGLTLINTVVNGVQLMEPTTNSIATTTATLNDDQSSDKLIRLQYKVILLAETRKATGASLAVWLYNQLTNSSSDKDDDGENEKDNKVDYSTQRPTSRAVTAISLISNSDDDNNRSSGYRVQVESELNVMMTVPNIVLRLLPMSLERVAAEGSAAVEKTVATAIAANLNRIGAAFAIWQQQEQKQNTK